MKPSQPFEITQASLNLFAEVSGDPNLIHLDEAAAKKSGLPGVIAHGMFIASLASSFVEDWILNSEYKGKKAIRKMQTRFKAMTFLGEQIRIQGAVKDKTAAEITLEVQAVNAKEEVKLVSQFTLGEPV